ncbi:MAG: hypothetical protein KDE48_08140 [Anaerolineales bacterium]|nr:hypothetical protein [Anaerolineales bacterium]
MSDFSFVSTAMLQDDGSGFFGALFGGVYMICWLVMVILIIAGFWKTFTKAGEPGWASIIPIYNIYIILRIIGKPWWWLLLMLIPFVNFVVWILIAIDMGTSFGKDTLFSLILLWLFTPIGYLILGFGDAQYQGPATKQA